MKIASTWQCIAMLLLIFISSTGAQGRNLKSAPDCDAPSTQKAMNECAYEDFLAATANYAQSNKSVMDKLHGNSRNFFRRAQKSWIAYRTATCAFESSAAHGGSVQGMIVSQCAARMTRARVVEMDAIKDCQEGDLACVRLKK